jgi:hypothetical protein
MADVRYLILCDEVHADPANNLRVDVQGLMTHIRSAASPPFPMVRPHFCVLVILTDCRGESELSLRIVQAETGKVVFRNRPRRVRFAGASREAVGITFRLRDCSFPAAGLYWVEFLESDEVKAKQALTLTS